MPSTSSLTEAPRKELHVFYVLDTSGSMVGSKISALNHAMEECLNALKPLAKSNGDAKLKVAVLEFNSGCKWVTSNGPEDLEEDFEYEYLEAGGITDIGKALTELNSKLSRHAFLNSMTGAFMPVIIFMTDGYATDDYNKALAEIRKNRWFARGIKIGFALGDDADEKMLASVVGNSEAVIKTTDLELFKRLMKFASVTASMLVSESQTTDTALTGKDILKKATEDIPSVEPIQLDPNQYDKEDDPDENDKDEWDEGEW
jgi:uncharacterized protein YegL